MTRLPKEKAGNSRRRAEIAKADPARMQGETLPEKLQLVEQLAKKPARAMRRLINKVRRNGGAK